jgi:LDH2 family malate/lactate/ureidoglycolate dehydrogenase
MNKAKKPRSPSIRVAGKLPSLLSLRTAMQLTLTEATDLALRALTRAGMSAENAQITTDHLIDAALCGHEFSSLPRVIALTDALRDRPPAQATRVLRENHCSALLDGGDNVAYVVSIHAIDKAVEIARKNGVAVVCANNCWFSGRLAYYVERAARQGFIALHTTNGTARVAPFGGVDRLMGTNPFAIAFPSEDDPLIIDIGTSATTWGDVVLARTKGAALPDGVAVNPLGQPTTDPQEALDGAILPWGGVRGSGLALAVQLLGMLAGSDLVIDDIRNYGLFFLVIDPKLFMPNGQYTARVTAFRQEIEANRAAAGVDTVRVPGDSSQQKRRVNREKGVINLDDKVHARLLELANQLTQ